MIENSPDQRTRAQLLEEIEQLSVRLDEAEQTLGAIRSGDVDALVVAGPQGDQVFSLTGAERTYRLIVETMNEAALTVDLAGTILFCNQRFSSLMKSPMAEIISRKLSTFVALAQQRTLQQILATAQFGPVKRRLTLRASDGCAVSVQLAASPLADSGNSSICLVASDLTELEKQANSIRVLFQQQQVLEERDSELQAANAALHLSRQAALNDSEKAIAAQQQAEELASQLQRQIEERKQAEQALSVSESLFRALFENSLDAVLLTVPDRSILLANPAACTMFGMAEEEIIRAGRAGLSDPDDPRHAVVIEERKRTGQISGVELDFIRNNGQRFPAEVDSVILPGEPERAFVIIRDITERKQVEELLRKNDYLMSEGQKIAHIGTFEYNVLTQQTTWSEEEYRIYGLDPGCPSPEYDDMLATCIHPDDRDNIHQFFISAMQSRSAYELEHRIVRSDGIRWVYERAHPYFDETGTLIHYIGTTLDITERKQAEEALRESDLKYSKLFQSRVSGLAFCEVVLDEQGRSVDYRFLEVNDAFTEMTGLRKEMVVGCTAREAIPGIEKSKFDFIATHGNVALTGEETTFETFQDYLDRWFSVHVYSPKKGFFVSIFSDITNRKRSEEQIKKSLAEKEVLLREIHHRVKNNLQVISSLINLQSAGLTDERMRDEFNDVRDRVRSMALIHEKLYQTSNLAQLNFADYTASLLGSLWRSYGKLAEKARLILALESVVLSMEAAVPCGLILNELAGNALKHAFPDGCDGEVTVSMERQISADTVCLRVRDNGVGLPAGMDWRQTSTLGLRLVRILAVQLHGTVDTGVGPGAEFQITFPLTEAEP